MVSEMVHVGVGNFFRAHLAAYFDALFGETGSPDWELSGLGMLESDRLVQEGLRAQGWTYSLVLKHPGGLLERRTIKSLRSMLLAPDDPWLAVARLADPRVRIVSMTITEGGYNIDDTTGRFDLSSPLVAADLAAGAAPRSVFGVLVRALQQRRANGVDPFTVLSCDNIEMNGYVARTALVSFARCVDDDLAQWIQEKVACPSSMVDRITPVTTDDDRKMLLDRWGLVDAVPVTCEPFTQWVIEDDFPTGRPGWERVGVQVVRDVRPYELMKLRLLNASHQAMAYFGLLLGHVQVHEAARNPALIKLMSRYMDEEATPTLEPLPDIDLAAYKAQLLARFANPHIGDTLHRLGSYASDRIPKWLLPVVRENLLVGRSCPMAVAVVASWLRYTETHRALLVDRRVGARTPEQLLEDATLFGDLSSNTNFTGDVLRVLQTLRDHGPTVALDELV